MEIKKCITFNTYFYDITKAKEIMIPIIEGLNPEDYFYLFYDERRFKVGIAGIKKNDIELKLKELEESKIISGFDFVLDECLLDISKIMTCAARKISEIITFKINPLDIDKMIEELSQHPEINADSYAPLHFIFNQLRFNYNEEAIIRQKLKLNPNYIKNYKQVGPLLLR